LRNFNWVDNFWKIFAALQGFFNWAVLTIEIKQDGIRCKDEKKNAHHNGQPSVAEAGELNPNPTRNYGRQRSTH
jgi:hypothetical protein